MSRMDWKAFLEHEGDEILTSLKKAEDAVVRAILGIWLFIIKTIPELARTFLLWLQAKFAYACRIALRLARIAGLLIAWAVIVFAPIKVYPGIITVSWAILAVVGSYWGLQRQFVKHQRITITEVKGVRNGR